MPKCFFFTPQNWQELLEVCFCRLIYTNATENRSDAADPTGAEINTASIWRRSWRRFIWTVTQPSLGKWVTGLYVTQTGVSPRRVMGPVRHEVPTERLGFVSQWGGLSRAPEFGPWLAAATQGAVCEEPRGSHSHDHMSSTRQWCSALGLTLLTFTLARLLSSWIYIKQCIWPKDDCLAIQKFQTLSKFYRIFNYHHGKFVGKSFLMFQTVWRHQTKKNANDYFLFIVKKKEDEILVFGLRCVARSIILQRHPVWTSREQRKCRGEHVKSKV